jgi:transposase
MTVYNNAVERAIRPVATGRHNWLFVASERGGQATAALYSLIESAKANGLNPYAYLRDVFTRLPVTKAMDIDSLLPHLWRPSG